jgi:bifunctional non-homologous end joining protein LigD
MSEPLLKDGRVRQRAKAVPHRVCRQVDVHIPLKAALFEPIENVHGRFVECQRHLIGKVSADLEDNAHDGFRIMARRDAKGVRLFTRSGYNFAARFPRIAEAIANLNVRSCFIDGEAIVVDTDGLSVFDLIRYRHYDRAAVLCAFDLIELDSEDLRRSPIEHRKRALAEVLGKKRDGIALNAHYEGDGRVIFKHACKLGCEGVVSKRLGSPYRSGRSDHWLKVKNPAAPAVRREAEEDWDRSRK